MARSGHGSIQRGYTLVELLIATTLTLVMMGGVATVFGMIGSSISTARAGLEMADALRAAAHRLSADLNGTTAILNPPRQPESGEGYFQVTEGPIGPVISPDQVSMNSDTGEGDSTVGDTDDLIAFTTRSSADPFVGRALIKRSPAPGESATGTDGIGAFVAEFTTQSRDAEVAYFVRGNSLYRRVLLVRPTHDADLRTAGVEMQLDSRRKPPVYNGGMNPPYPVVANPGIGFFNDYDLSVHMDASGALVPNTLSDLTKPKNRFAHQHINRDASGNLAVSYPFHPHFFVNWQAIYNEVNSNGTHPAIAYDSWAPAPLSIWRSQRSVWGLLGLPTLGECSYLYPGDPTIDLTPANGLNSWIAGGGEIASVAEWPGHLPVTTWEWPGHTPLFTPANPSSTPSNDAWLAPYAVAQCNVETGSLALAPITPYPGSEPTRYSGSRVAEDVILKNVLEFDIKVWDPNAPVIAVWNTMGTPGTADDFITAVVLPGDRGYIRAMYLRDNLDPDTTQHPNTRYTIAGFGAYVDLNYLCRLGPWDWNGTDEFVDPAYPSSLPIYADAGRTPSAFSGPGDYRSGLRGTRPSPAFRPLNDSTLSNPIVAYRGALRPAVYDTWSVHYESDGLQQGASWYPNPAGGSPPWLPLPRDSGANGLDDDGNGLVDDLAEMEAPPPYAVPLRGIQIKIRVFEPDSRQIREVTIVHSFAR